MPRADKATFIQGMLSEHQVRQQWEAQKPATDSKEWWREVAQGLGAELGTVKACAEAAEAKLAEVEQERDLAQSFHDVAVQQRDTARREIEDLTAKLAAAEQRAHEAHVEEMTSVEIIGQQLAAAEARAAGLLSRLRELTR